MKRIIHRANTRGQAEHSWLHSFHTFSFASYYNAKRNRFGKLRVLNDDVVQPGQGFSTHPHENMEIVSIPLKGSLRHKDNMGNTHVILAGEVQVMSAGTGITHSEYNDSDIDPVNFLQIWILPKKKDITPRYDQSVFAVEDRNNRFQAIVSPDGANGSLCINQDARFSLTQMDQGQNLTYQLHDSKNGVYIFVIEGEVDVAGESLARRDAIGVTEAQNLEFYAKENSQILCIETPME
jgi:redox-sensitive bicupin YhaK (pirin superfamily)